MAARPESLEARTEERRRRVLTTTLRLVAEGGVEAVQMRQIADESGIALASLYRYHPSKEHLLVSLMLETVKGFAAQFERRPARGTTRAERVLDVLTRSGTPLPVEPELFSAWVKAMIATDERIHGMVQEIIAIVVGVITDAMGVDDPTPEDVDTARIVLSVWLASATASTMGVAAERLTTDLVQATRILFRDDPPPVGRSSSARWVHESSSF